jgi:hypothetical protein
VSEYQDIGALVYDVNFGGNDTVVFAWQQTANSTAHQFFHLDSNSGTIWVAQSLAGQGGKHFSVCIDVYFRYGDKTDHQEALQISIFITKAVVCNPSILNITITDNISVGTTLAPLQCEVLDNSSVPLKYSIASDHLWRKYFRMEDLINSSYSTLIINSSLMASPPPGSKIQLDILVTSIGTSFQFNNTMQVYITIRHQGSIISCSNTTVAIHSPAELGLPLHHLCKLNHGFANVSAHILLDAGLPFWLSNDILRLHPNATMKDRAYLVSLNVTAIYGNITSWSVSFITVAVAGLSLLSPHLHPSNAFVTVNENTAPPILVQLLQAVNFPTGGISFDLRSRKNPTAGSKHISIHNSSPVV